MRAFIRAAVLLCLLANTASAQTQVLCNQGSSKVPCTAPLQQTYVPSAIPATKVGGGAVDNTEYGYLDGVTSSIQTQLNAKQGTLTLPLSKANGGWGSDVSTGLTTNYVAIVAGGAITIGPLLAAALPSGIDAAKIGGGTVTNTIFSYLDATSSIQTQLNGLQPLDADLTAISALTGTGGLARVTTNTWTLRSIAAGTGITVTNGDFVAGNPTVALTNSSLTIAAGTGLSVSGCSPVGLGGTCTPSIAATAVSSGSYPASGQIPTFTVNAQGQLTAAGSTTTLTSPAISSPTFSGTYTLGGTPTVPASGLSGLTNHGILLGQSSNGVASPSLGTSGYVFTSNGSGSDPSFQAPAAPTLTSAVGSATTLNQTTGTWQDITGMSLSLGAGTQTVTATIRSEISQTVTGGAFIQCRLHDGTNPISNSETLTAQANTPSVLEQTTTIIEMDLTLASTTTIKVQCARVFTGTILTSDVPSDSNGRSRIKSVKYPG